MASRFELCSIGWIMLHRRFPSGACEHIRDHFEEAQGTNYWIHVGQHIHCLMTRGHHGAIEDVDRRDPQLFHLRTRIHPALAACSYLDQSLEPVVNISNDNQPLSRCVSEFGRPIPLGLGL